MDAQVQLEDRNLFAYWPILQQTPSDCGVACLAMATGVTYASALYTFEHLGLARKRKGRTLYSSNFRELREALRVLHRPNRLKRFVSWEGIAGPAIVKVDNGSRYNWHWVYATRSDEHGLVILDPTGPRHLEYGYDGLDNRPLADWRPKGSWICLETKS